MVENRQFRHWLSYVTALGAPVLLTVVLLPVNSTNPRDYAFLYLGVVAVLGIASGVGPAVMAALTSFLLVDYYFVPPFHTLTIGDYNDLVNLVVFVIAAVLVGGVGSLRRRAQLRASALAADLAGANAELQRLNREQAKSASVAVHLARTEQQVRVLEQSDRIRRELLANVSHELRTPLASILTGTTDLLGDSDLAPRVREELHSVATEANRLSRLVADMLDMARIDAHALALDPHDLDVREALEAAATRLGRIAPKRPVQVRVEGDALEAVADWDRLGQILDNLLGNADRHAPPGTPIRLEASLGKRSMVVIRVIDAGPGIPAGEGEHIFERFVGLSDLRPGGDHASHGGTGLGLAIVRGLVEAHAGRIWVEDPGSGEGARFAFTLPAA